MKNAFRLTGGNIRLPDTYQFVRKSKRREWIGKDETGYGRYGKENRAIKTKERRIEA